MRHGGAVVEIIGLVISLHILGMYGLSPVAGQLTDRLGSPVVVLVGVALLMLACLLAGLSSDGFSGGLTAGMILLGLGWSCTMVAGSGTVAGSVPVAERAAVQGAADLVMDLWSYGTLCALAAAAALALGAFTVARRRVVSLKV
jgi:MFS family permease